MNTKLALVFPGQGSQSVGMLAELAEAYPVIKETFDTASEVLGYDLWQRVKNGPEEQLNHTTVTQPALLAAGVGLWRVWRTCTDRLPDVMAGHSLGEYTALVCAGSLDFATAITLVAKRGVYMQEAVPAGEGAMAAILGLDETRVSDICSNVAQGEIVSAANYNAPGQVVVAGHTQAVQRAVAEARQNGARRVVMLAVSVPSHCALMEPAAQRLAQDLLNMEIKQPNIPVINNVDVAIPHTVDDVRAGLVRQLYHPVRWVEIIQKMTEQGIDTLIECGPGKVLSALNKRIAPQMTALPTCDLAHLHQAVASVRE